MSMLKGKKLLNMDSEEEGVRLASCAGGCRADVKLPVERETVSGTKLTVSLSGLTGGHSGSEIDKGRDVYKRQLIGRGLNLVNNGEKQIGFV